MHAVSYLDCMHADTEPVHGTEGPADDQIAYKVPHAARVLDLSERQMWDLVGKGEIDSFKIGTSRRISRAALVAYIERHRDAA